MSDSRRRTYQVGALAIATLVIVGVLLVTLTNPAATPLVPGKPVPGAGQARRLFAGIPQRGITVGRENAPVTLVEFGDLQCPYCAMFAKKALPSILTHFVRTGQVRLIFRNLDGLGSDSVRAAMMAGALGRQNHLWEFVDLAYRNQGDENSGYVTDDFLRAIAEVIPGVNVKQALNERSSAFVKGQIAQAMSLAHQLKLKVTPSFLLFATGGREKMFTPSSLDGAAFAGPLRRMLLSAGG
jgi:protein-disulfide isomerase